MQEIFDEIEQLVAPMIKRRLFVCLSEPTGPDEHEVPHLPDHLRHLIELERQGVLFASGPFVENGRPGQHALMIVRAESEDEARKILADEPLHKLGLRKSEVHEWMLNEGRVSLHLDFSSQTGGLDGHPASI